MRAWDLHTVPHVWVSETDLHATLVDSCFLVCTLSQYPLSFFRRHFGSTPAEAQCSLSVPPHASWSSAVDRILPRAGLRTGQRGSAGHVALHTRSLDELASDANNRMPGADVIRPGSCLGQAFTCNEDATSINIRDIAGTGRHNAPRIRHTLRGSLDEVLTASSTVEGRHAALQVLDRDQHAQTAMGPRRSLLNTWSNMHHSWFGADVPVLPLDEIKLHAVAALFKAGRYRSFSQYHARQGGTRSCPS